MDRETSPQAGWPAPIWAYPLLLLLGSLALASLAYDARMSWIDSADLARRAEESNLFRARADPYDDQSRDNTYPPSALPIFALLVPGIGTTPLRVMWLALNLGAMAGLVLVVLKTWCGSWPAWLKLCFAGVVLASKPCRAGIALGQFHLLPTLGLVLAEAAVAAGHNTRAGLGVGLALIKPTMAVPYAISLLARRRWVALSVACGTQAALWLGAAAWLGVGPIRLGESWLRNARSQVTAGTIDVPTLLAGQFDPTAASLMAMTAAAAVIARFRDRSSLGQLSLALFAAAVVTYHRPYDMVLLLPTLAYLIDGAWRGRGWWTVVVTFLLGAALVAPSHPRVMPIAEPIYLRFFVIVAYSALGTLLALMTTETPTAPVPSERGDRGRRWLGPPI